MKKKILILLSFVLFFNGASLKKNKENINFIILAGGKGSRMGGDTPKVLKEIDGKTMLQRIIEECNKMKKKENNIFILPVISKDMNENFKHLISKNPNTNYIIEEKRNGTAGAVKLGVEHIKNTQDITKNNITYILIGDAPTIKSTTFQKMKKCLDKFDVCAVGFIDNEKNSFGKMILKDGQYDSIYELKAIKEAKAYKENEVQPIICNSGLHAHKTKLLNKYLPNIKKWEKTGELNINDIIEIYTKNNIKVGMIVVDKEDVFAANTPEEFAQLKEIITSNKK